MKYHNGNIYEGCWKNDYRDGSGKMESSNGEVYDGKVIQIIMIFSGNMIKNMGKEFFTSQMVMFLRES